MYNRTIFRTLAYLRTKERRGVVVITSAQLNSTKPELGFCAGSNPARGVLAFRDGEDLRQWSQLEIRLNAFYRSTIPQKQINSTSSEACQTCKMIMHYRALA